MPIDMGGNFPSNPQEEKLYFQGKDLLGDLWELRSVPISSSGAVGKIITSILVSQTQSDKWVWEMKLRSYRKVAEKNEVGWGHCVIEEDSETPTEVATH